MFSKKKKKETRGRPAIFNFNAVLPAIRLRKAERSLVKKAHDHFLRRSGAYRKDGIFKSMNYWLRAAVLDAANKEIRKGK